MSKTTEILINLKTLSQKSKSENIKYFKVFNKKNMRELDEKVHKLHEDVFNEINCLECANCCKTLGPRITDKDIDRISKSLKIKASTFINQYLKIDEDGDYVFQSMPCPFLMNDNYCMIYNSRPKACREYPHTDRVKFFQISKLTITNSETCPAVWEILERLRKEF